MENTPSPPTDRISNLPDNVIDILTCLKTRDAAKTCILSKQWRYRWVKLPHLIFDNSSFYHELVDRMTFVLMLYEVILRHQGLITKLSLSVGSLERCTAVDHLINFASKNGVEEFIFRNREKYKLPSSLFMCSWLKHLSLDSCLIRPPPAFKGFNMLITLKLCKVIIDNEVLQNLISSSPLLEQLVLSVKNKFDCLNINASMLKLFDLTCFAYSVCFKRCPLLAIASVVIPDRYIEDDEFDRGNGHCVQLFDSLPALEKLRMDFYFLKNLGAGRLQTRLPANLVHLKILKLSDICFSSVNEFSGVVCLIRISPKLEEISITNVELKLIAGRVREMMLIKLLLVKSLKLTKMVIWIEYIVVPNEKIRILTEVNKFERASPNANVIVDTDSVGWLAVP